MTATHPAVLIVGAGAVGLVAAAELTRRGVSVRIIDKLAEPTTESRAIAVHARSLDMLDRMGIAEKLIATGVKSRGMELYSGSKRLLRVPLDSVDAAYPFTLVTPQTETERVLTEHLASLGVTVERSVALTGLNQDDDAVHVTLRHDDGAVEEFDVAWVIGADGARSPVRHFVGGKLEGNFVGERFLLGDVDAEHNLDADSMYTFFSAEGPVLVMPMRDGRARVMAQVHDAPGTPLNLDPSMAELQQILDRRVAGITLTHPHWMTSFELHHALVPQYRWGRVFLAGDAAHIHSPAGGQGMNTGMQDAFNLAWKLAAVVNGQGGDTLLDSYYAERHLVAERMITFTDRLSKAGTLTGAPRRLRDALMRLLAHVGPLPRAMANAAAEVNIAYRGGPIAVGAAPHGAKVAAGEHFPCIRDEELQKRLTAVWGLDHTTVTVAVGQSAPAARGTGQQVLVTDTDAPVPGYDLVIADPQRLLARRLGLKAGGRVVVRPDTYIGAVAALSDATTVTNYFTTIAG